jgi:hypothetical protein
VCNVEISSVNSILLVAQEGHRSNKNIERFHVHMPRSLAVNKVDRV